MKVAAEIIFTTDLLKSAVNELERILLAKLVIDWVSSGFYAYYYSYYLSFTCDMLLTNLWVYFIFA